MLREQFTAVYIFQYKPLLYYWEAGQKLRFLNVVKKVKGSTTPRKLIETSQEIQQKQHCAGKCNKLVKDKRCTEVM